MSRKSRTPKYRLHKQSGQAIVTLPDGLGRHHDVLLGTFDSPESHELYGRIIAEWKAGTKLTNGNSLPDITINELIVGFWKFGEKYFGFGKQPKRGDEDCFRYAFRVAKELYGSTPAKEFGPLALKACRSAMVDKGWSRNYVNAQTERIRRMFKWAAEEELVPCELYFSLRNVASLVKGKNTAPETEKVLPVPEDMLHATIPHMPKTVQAMVRFEWLTGCRPDEACSLRPTDLDLSNPKCWVYQPDKHKTEHQGTAGLSSLVPRPRRSYVLTWEPISMISVSVRFARNSCGMNRGSRIGKLQ